MSDSQKIGPIPPYGVAIHEAISSGDVEAMKQVAEQAKDYLQHAEEVRKALHVLDAELDKLTRQSR